MIAEGTHAEPPAGPADIGALLGPILNPAYGTALHLTREPADAEDLVQEAVLLAVRGFKSFEPGTNFKAWFFRILTNAFYSKYRKQKRQGIQVELEDAPELHMYTQTEAIGLHSQTEDPAGLLMNKLDTEAVSAAIAALPEEYRMVCSLYFMQDLSYQEIATMLDIPVGTVRSRLHRGRRMLQQTLWRVAEDRGIVRELAGRAGEGA